MEKNTYLDGALVLKRGRDRHGRPVRGLWECDIVRMEHRDGLWAAQVPMRPLGLGKYWEYATIPRGGSWMSIGNYCTRNGAMHTALQLHSGLCVWEPWESEEAGVLRQWTDVSGDLDLTVKV